MKAINTYITERLVLSKNKKTPDITLEEFVRWYHSDKNGNYLVDIDELDEQDILEAIDHVHNWKTGRIAANDTDEAFHEYYKNKDKILEDINETHKGNYYYVEFVAGDLDLEVRCPWSFIDFLNNYEKD